MEASRANKLLQSELQRIHQLLAHEHVDAQDERSSANEQGDMSDSAPPLVSEQEGAAVTEGLRERLAAIERAQQRILNGTYGFSVRSGEPIPGDRLEADPAAELTVDEIRSA